VIDTGRTGLAGPHHLRQACRLLGICLLFETKIKKMDLPELDRHALDAGRNFIDNQVRVGAVSQPDGLAY